MFAQRPMYVWHTVSKNEFYCPWSCLLPSGIRIQLWEIPQEFDCTCLPHSVGYICMIHEKKNRSEKCSKLDLSNELIRETKEDIFDQRWLNICKEQQRGQWAIYLFNSLFKLDYT